MPALEFTRSRQLPPWRSVLAVVAHPDDESFGLGAVLTAFVDAGARVAALCLTCGEASTLRAVEGDLATLRAVELAEAAQVLGAHPVRLLHYPVGALSQVDVDELAAHVLEVAVEVAADGLLAFDSDGVTGHPDHVHATKAALAAGQRLDLGVLGWTIPFSLASTLAEEHAAPFSGHDPEEVDLVIVVDRARQHQAIARHTSQAAPGSVLWRRLELLGDHEHLRWLRRSPTPHPNDGTSM
jgi:LmbE family N-acetylglucosaminyl deacetylase